MQKKSRVDIAAGLLVIVFGVSVVVYSNSNYDVGSLRFMGPGMFPSGVGIALILLGLGLLPAARAEDLVPSLRISRRACVAVILSVVAFALSVERLGLVVAVLLSVGIAAHAEAVKSYVKLALWGLTLTVLVLAIFKYGLGMSLSIFPRTA